MPRPAMNPNAPLAFPASGILDTVAPRVYVTKRLEDGTVEAYDRGYWFLGTLTATGQDYLQRTARALEVQEGWTGGRTHAPGRAVWWQMGQVPRQAASR